MYSSLKQCTVALYQKLISNREMDFHRFCLPLFCCKSVLIWFVSMYMHQEDCMLCVCLYFLCICSVFVVADYNSWRALLMLSERNITCCDEHRWSWLTNFHMATINQFWWSTSMWSLYWGTYHTLLFPIWSINLVPTRIGKGTEIRDTESFAL